MSRRDANPWLRPAPLVLGHRGQRATIPEQTLESYEAALVFGADGIETDVQLTADGRLAMVHDLTLDRTTNGHGPVAAHDWASLRALDAGSWFGAAFSGYRIPSLEETIELVVGAGRLLCVEIKGDAGTAPRTAAAVARLVRERSLLDQVFISSFDHAALAAARREAGSPLLAPERLPDSGPSDPATAASQAIELDAAILQHRWEDLTPEVTDALHAAGVGIWTWPVDDVAGVNRSVELGADGIIGDDVPFLLEAVGRPVASAAATIRP
ncbi:MAG TPA: glycerophosphodiester phosphodiesterase family protein [Patescibacteria group bacterium]|nr:glycerophosphodiester phosphodiesterase family protein [Patescibacteria group bacterium]